MALTAYHVLRETTASDGAVSYEPVESNVQAHSSDHALRQTVKETGTYVAVPARSFAPSKVSIRTQTVTKIE